MVLSSYMLVLTPGFGEVMASKLAKLTGQSSTEWTGKSASVPVCRPGQWGQALQSACLRLMTCQLRVLPGPEASPGAGLSLGRGSVAGGREDVGGH